MLLEKDLKTDKYKHQSPEYLDDEVLFSKQKSIDFDEYKLITKKDVTLSDGRTEAEVKCSPIPLEWDESSYAYHPEGDYQIYTITNSTKSVGWQYDYYLKENPVHDRKWHDTEGAEEGNFIYVNASNQPGKLLSLNWTYGNLCPQNRIYVSGWVNEVSYNKETANLAIKIVGIEEDGKETILNTYITGYVPCGNTDKTGQNPVYEHQLYQKEDGEWYPYYTGQWFHIYYSFIPEGDALDTDFKSYRLVIENNSAGSDGADYLLDDFRLYVDKAAIRAEQIKTGCDNNVTIRVSREYSNIYTRETTLSYQLYDVNRQKIKNGYGTITNFNPNDFDKNEEWNESTFNKAMQLKVGAAEYICFNKELYFIAKGESAPDDGKCYIMPGKEYYIAFGTEQELNSASPESQDSKCAKYCKFKVLKNLRPEVDGVEDDGQLSYCYGSNELVTMHMYDHYGNEVEGVTYDWFHGSMKDFNSITGLGAAIGHFREEYPEQVGLDEGVKAKGELTDNDIAILQGCIDERKLILVNSESNLIQMTKLYTSFVVIPTGNITTEQTYCPNPAEIILYANGGSPSLTVGFNDIKYPAYEEGFDKMIRIKQTDLLNTLLIPVCDPKIVAPPAEGPQSSPHIINDTEDNYIYLYDTDDPSLRKNISKIHPSVGTSIIDVTDEGGQHNITLKFDKDDEKNDYVYKFREGYRYAFYCMIQKAPSQSEGQVGTCDKNNMFFMIGVVPEYQTWVGGKNGNWNSDANWVRSSNAEIHHKETIKDDPKTTGGTLNSFVPMAFTKVVMPKDQQVQLYEPAGVNVAKGRLLAISGDVTAYTSKGEETITKGASPSGMTDATKHIEYDIMADVESTTAENTIECRPYYTNTVAQIHFETGAEMLNSGLLTHEKAWVDYEIVPKQWYALATPLQGVVAGDWYAPTDNGRQETEYYTPINFSDDKNDDGVGDYSRVKPAVYQRGWKGSATMYMSSTDGDTKSVAVKGNWSAMYNDVNVAYTPGSGFSLKVTDAPKGNLLFRLPKADTEYSYYTYNNDGTTTAGHEVAIDRGKDIVPGKLTDGAGEYDLVSPADGEYYLVGNPFMAHLDMEKFFAGNTGLEKTYTTVEAGSQTTGDATGTVAPLRSFFVKKATGSDVTKVTFTDDMQVLGSSTTSGGGSGAKLHISAVTDDGRTSNAIVCYSDEASADYDESEDAMLFVDSNLGDLPMVYTVGGDRALAVNSTPAGRVPLNVYGQDDNDVTLRFSNIPEGTDLCLYDAASRTATPLAEGYEVAVRTNDNGRYYLTGSTTGIGETAATDGSTIAVWSARSGELTVATTATALRDVKVYGMAGTLAANSDASNRNSITLTVPAGNVYIVTATDSNGTRRTAKVMVF